MGIFFRLLVLVFVCIFIGVGLFAFSKALVLFRSNSDLTRDIDTIYKPRIASLERQTAQVKEKLASAQESIADLEKRNAVMEDTVREKNAALKKLNDTFAEAKVEYDRMHDEYASLDNENRQLKERMNAMFVEFNNMKKILSSVDKLEEHLETLKGRRRSRGGDRYSNADSSGNGGYLVRNGQSTYQRLRIRVLPAEG